MRRTSLKLFQRDNPSIGQRLVRSVIIVQLTALLILISGDVFLRFPIGSVNHKIIQLSSIRDALDGMEVAMIDEETGQRGYDLTGDPVFLHPYTTGTTDFESHSSRLLQLIGGMSGVPPSVRQSISTAQVWHNSYGAPQVQERQDGQSVTAASLLRGNSVMNQFRNQVHDATTWVQGQILSESAWLDELWQVSVFLHVGIIAITMLIVTLLLLVQFRNWSMPIGRLALRVKAYGAGELNAPMTLSHSEPELNSLFSGIESMRQELLVHMTELEAKAHVDALTGVGNRRYFEQQLLRYIQEANDNETSFCLMMLDIDHFKCFNDTYGHPAGDHVLASVAETISRLTADGGTVSRYGGEEFVVLVPGEATRGLRLAENIRSEIERQGTVTVSIGTAVYDGGIEASELLAQADDALYAAKSGGRNRINTYHPPSLTPWSSRDA